MNRFFTKIIFIALMQCCAQSLSAHVELDYPLGGETFNAGQTVTIQWHIAIAHNTLNWDLLFSSDGGSTWEFIQVDLPPGSLSYQWIVPQTLTSQARVSVIQDNSGADYQDESNNFTIQAPPMPPIIIQEATSIEIESDVNTQDDAIQSWLDNHGGASATGFCGTLIWTYNYVLLNNGCGITGSAVVIFTATDDCGSAETVATVTVVDTSPPVMDIQATDLAVECNGTGNAVDLGLWLENEGGAIASDVAGNVTWTNDYSSYSNGCGTSGSANVIFTASDECGNISTTSATFTIEDHLTPGIDIAAQDTTIECGLPNTQTVLQNWLGHQGGAKASDVCGSSIVWTNDFPVVVDTCHASTTVPVHFTAIDECGNRNTTSAVVTLMGTSGTSTPGLPALNINISPNPVHEVLKVEFGTTESQLTHIQLFDAFGHQVISQKEEATEAFVPIFGFTPGVYFLHIETKYGVYTGKVLID